MRPPFAAISRILRSVGCALGCLIIFTASSARATQEWKVPIFPGFEFKDLTLQEFVDLFRRSLVPYDVVGHEPPNVVIDTNRISPARLTARISMQETSDITCIEVLHSVCKALGVGYRIDNHAIIISSRERVGLPVSPSRRTALVPDGAPHRFLVFVATK